MKYLLLICFQLLAAFAFGQVVIRGIVLDDKTKQRLPYASVYINYTTIGTNADEKGEFVLNLSAGEHDLVVSFVGHRPFQAKVNLVDGDEIVITVRLELLQLQEVQVKAKRDAKWERQLEKFKKLFLGRSANSKLCKILNPGVLVFPETSNGIFTAQALDVLEIENLSLGYRISYELKNFAVSNDNHLVGGYVRFQELQSTDTTLAKKWTQKRKEAFEGSIRHLLQTIIEQCVVEERYELYEDKSEMTSVIRDSRFMANVDKTIFHHSMQDKVQPGPRPYTYTVQLPTRLEVHYKEKNANATVYTDVPYPVSWIEVRGGSLTVTGDGLVLNPLKMTVLGAMFDARIAELLPNNYKPEKKVSIYQDPVERKPLSKLAYLTERPYLQTDKSYYYPNEVVWFKGYMNYYSPMLKDSLSHVLYVDLADKQGRIVFDAGFPIANNMVVGDFTLPSFIESGDYTLRAYTRWMLNFDREYLFKKPIKILKMGELAKTKEYQPDESANNIIVTTEKDQYEHRERITVSAEILDDLERNVPANLSISVTDLDQAVPAPNEGAILNDFPIPIVALPDTLDTRTRFLIQHGFDVKGKFITPKQKQPEGLLRFIQEDSNYEFVITTEADGSFYIPNLNLYDTARLSVVARTIKGRSGKVEFDTTSISPRNLLAGPLQIETFVSDKPRRHYIPDFSEAKILDVVTVKAERIERTRSSPIIADMEISGDWVRESRAMDVLSALQMKIAGFRVIVRMDANGFPVKYLALGGVSSFGNTTTQEPLVLIDGLVVNDVMGGPALQIEMLNPNQIEKIEISRYANSAAFGARGANGIISITTSRTTHVGVSGGLGAYDKSMLQPLPIKGFSTNKKFISPDYSTPEQNGAVPDNRSTIYWNPLLQTKDKPAVVSFFAADVATRYRIVVEGVTMNGKAVRAEKIIIIGKLP